MKTMNWEQVKIPKLIGLHYLSTKKPYKAALLVHTNFFFHTHNTHTHMLSSPVDDATRVRFILRQRSY